MFKNINKKFFLWGAAVGTGCGLIVVLLLAAGGMALGLMLNRNLGSNQGTPTSISTTNVAGNTIQERAVQIALAQLGKPYRFGAKGPYSFDCSGLIYYSYKQVGCSIPSSSLSIYNSSQPISIDQLQPGDIIFIDKTGKTSGWPYHIVMYIGPYYGKQYGSWGDNINTNMAIIQAPRTGDWVKVNDFNDYLNDTCKRYKCYYGHINCQ